jgi:hypothetical protein
VSRILRGLAACLLRKPLAVSETRRCHIRDNWNRWRRWRRLAFVHRSGCRRFVAVARIAHHLDLHVILLQLLLLLFLVETLALGQQLLLLLQQLFLFEALKLGQQLLLLLQLLPRHRRMLLH